MRNNLSVIGYYTSNFGDLLMLKGLLNTIPQNYRLLYILTYGQLSLCELGDVGLERKRIQIVNLTRSKIKNVLPLITAMFTSKAIIWGGGTCFNPKENAYGGLRYMKLFHKWGASVNYLGIGINTNQKTPVLIESLREALKISDYFIVRDKESQDLIRTEIEPAFNYLEPDLIYLNHFESFAITPKDDIEKIAFVSYRCVDSYYVKSKDYRDAFISNLIKVLETIPIDRVILYPSDRIIDFADNEYIAKEVIKHSPKTVLVDFLDSIPVTEALSLIERSKIVITGRLHVGVVSAIFGVPFQLLDYSSKNRAFIKDMGLNDKVLVNYESLDNEMTMCSNLLQINGSFVIPETFPPNTKSLEMKLSKLI